MIWTDKLRPYSLLQSLRGMARSRPNPVNEKLYIGTIFFYLLGLNYIATRTVVLLVGLHKANPINESPVALLADLYFVVHIVIVLRNVHMGPDCSWRAILRSILNTMPYESSVWACQRFGWHQLFHQLHRRYDLHGCMCVAEPLCNKQGRLVYFNYDQRLQRAKLIGTRVSLAETHECNNFCGNCRIPARNFRRFCGMGKVNWGTCKFSFIVYPLMQGLTSLWVKLLTTQTEHVPDRAARLPSGAGQAELTSRGWRRD